MKRIKYLFVVVSALGLLICLGQDATAQNRALEKAKSALTQKNMAQSTVNARQNTPKKQMDKSKLSQMQKKKAQGIVNRQKSAERGEKKLPTVEREDFKNRVNARRQSRIADLKEKRAAKVADHKAKLEPMKAEILKKVEARRNRIKENQKQSKL